MQLTANGRRPTGPRDRFSFCSQYLPSSPPPPPPPRHFFPFVHGYYHTRLITCACLCGTIVFFVDFDDVLFHHSQWTDNFYQPFTSRDEARRDVLWNKSVTYRFVSIGTPFANHKSDVEYSFVVFNYDQSLTFVTNLKSSAAHLFSSMVARDPVVSLLFIIEVWTIESKFW